MAPIANFLLAHISFRLPPYLSSYVSGQTPLSTVTSVNASLAGYLAITFGIQALMKDRQPYKLTTLFRAHNIVLSLGSALLLVLIMEEIVPLIWQRGLHHSICSPEVLTPSLEFYFMINYYFKYLELFDTVSLVLRKKPLRLLHVYHHTVTAGACFLSLEAKLGGVWSAMSLNLAIHIVMYYYYYATTGGARFWWKRYLTTVQIVQFVVDIFLVIFGTYEHYAHSNYPQLPHFGDCYVGSVEGANIFAFLVLLSFLGLFIDYYIQTYKKQALKSYGYLNGLQAHRKEKTRGPVA
ncbi:hypothetical protein NP233_g33 [Leucocoprinus birnbaumii]|uniref:Elongation of fatty acids protein n=1 Tax=Leucocoprinus birnbaumii TaxID=56174 RepID=A0AAD5YYX0_9AGAR|nr:hypothetical protein NP233_g33 [Leucocoprinus birnbaumii]